MENRLEAENLLIGSILKDGNLIKETTLQPKHFTLTSNKIAMQVMRDLEDKKENIDMVSVLLASNGELNKKNLAFLVNGVPSLKTFSHTEKTVFKAYQLEEAERIKQLPVNSPDDIERIKNELASIDVQSDNEEYDHKQALIDLYDKIEQQEEGLSGYDTGFKSMNSILDGFQEGDLYISAARPSAGKTAKMLSHAVKHGEKGGISIIFSLEMDSESLNKRMLSSIGKINGHKMRNPRSYFNGNDWENLTYSLAILSNMNIKIYDQSGVTTSFVKEKVRNIRSEYPDREILVMIDYLQLMRTDKKFENKNIEVDEISKDLKELAKEEKVPVYLLSQLSRGVEARQDKRPMLSDLRDSGGVEQNADVVEMLYRDDYYNPDSESQGIIEVIIAKQRNGSVGTVELSYQKEHNGFYDLEYRYDD